jgi:hypothetical protein
MENNQPETTSENFAALSEGTSTMAPCPNHEGAYDCTPFCPICEGEQEYEIGE